MIRTWATPVGSINSFAKGSFDRGFVRGMEDRSEIVVDLFSHVDASRRSVEDGTGSVAGRLHGSERVVRRLCWHDRR